jgi:hypothetical protein
VQNRIPLDFPAAAHLRDHQFNGRPVLPAVEAMEILAVAAAEALPQIECHRIDKARFDRFLPLVDSASVGLWVELESEADTAVTVTLRSKRRGKQGITRTLTHAAMRLGGADDGCGPIDKHEAIDGVEADLEGPQPSPERIYAELVPFGPSYRNLSAIIAFGARAIAVKITPPPIEGPFRLGNPFVLDAAFHAACVWAQRYAGVVAFPVGFKRRRILKPCRSGHVYEATIRVRERDPALLVFNITIANQGEICELVTGVGMRDVSGGRLKPPNWIRSGADSDAGA